MSGQLSDFSQPADNRRAVASRRANAADTRTGRRRGRGDWRSDKALRNDWPPAAIVIALFGMGSGILGAGILLYLLPAVPAASTAVLWSGLIAATLIVFSRGRPAGLMRWRGSDLLWGIGVGLFLRLLQGWVGRADEAPFPSIGGASGAPAASWWLSDVVPVGLIGPVVEEFFFRAVLLVATYLVLRRKLRSLTAGVAATTLSVGAFVLLHSLRTEVALGEGLMLFALGSGAAVLVLLTGRLWAAVILHVVYNVSYLALVFVGTTLA